MTSTASEAFRKCYADLIRGIQDPEILALELYSTDVISKTVMKETHSVWLPRMERTTRLLSAVEHQIAVNPTKFQKFLLALRMDPVLEYMADKLETIYKNLGM